MGKPRKGAKGFRASRLSGLIARQDVIRSPPRGLLDRLHADAFQKPLVEGGCQLWLRAIPPAIGERLARVHDLLAFLAPPVNDQVPFVGDTDFLDSGRSRPTTAP